MSKAVSDVDSKKVNKVGGHTLRMRDFGQDKVPGTSDDLLNNKICQHCHRGLEIFDRNDIQSEVRELGRSSKKTTMDICRLISPAGGARYHHSGGTVSFLNDSNMVLENAYTNYKLIINNRSFGIHNPGYVKKLLQDSINAVKSME